MEEAEERRYEEMIKEMKEKEESKINVLRKAKRPENSILQKMLDEPF